MRSLLFLTFALAACGRPAPTTLGRADAVPDGAAPARRASTGQVAAAAAPFDAAAPQADASAAPLYAPRTVPLVKTEGVTRLGTDAGFPAVNRDGTEVVLLAHDTVDFVGAAVEHVVFLDVRTSRTTVDALVYDELGERDRTSAQVAELRRKRAASVAEASKRLAATTWRTLERSRPSDEPASGPWLPVASARADGGGSLSVRFGSDLDVELPSNSLSSAPVALTVLRLREGRVVPSVVRARTPLLATQNGMTGSGAKGPCGSVSWLDGWADPERRFVLLALQAAVAGDSCSVSLDSDTMMLVLLPR